MICSARSSAGSASANSGDRRPVCSLDSGRPQRRSEEVAMRYRLLVVLTLLLVAMSCARGQFIATVDLLPVPDAPGVFSGSAAFNHVAPAEFSDAVFFRADAESRLTIAFTLLPSPGLPHEASFFLLSRVH